ncbi:MAG TPA: hypothetical protein VIN39_08495, partial [Candidatus Dormibacteraeota bacterium]
MMPQRAAGLAFPAASRQLLASLSQNAISGAAYDTAFVARLRATGEPQTLAYPKSLAYLLRTQNPDGSFGTNLPIPKEKLISTLSALVALADLPTPLQD